MTYKEKIQKIKSFKSTLISLMQTVPNVLKVSGNRLDILTSYEYPLIVVNYLDGDQVDYRENANAVVRYEITLVQYVSDESESLDICADIADKFEDPTQGGEVIGCKISLPQNYYEKLNNRLNVKSIMEVEIEI